ncbi:MAG: hypothetical protein Q9170_002079 [Blastenia crenularia]
MRERVLIVVGTSPVTVGIGTWSLEARGIDGPTKCDFRLVEDPVILPSNNRPLRRITTGEIIWLIHQQQPAKVQPGILGCMALAWHRIEQVPEHNDLVLRSLN